MATVKYDFDDLTPDKELSMERTSEITGFLNNFIKDVSTYRDLLDWELSRSCSSESELERQFEPVKLPFQFPERGEYWFRAFFKVPETIRRISVTGSAFRLRCFMTLPTRVFIDGQKIFDEKYWTDFQMPEVTVTEAAAPEKPNEILVCVICNDSLEATGEKMEITLYSEAIERSIFELEAFLAELDFVNSLPELREEKARIESFLLEKLYDGILYEDLLALVKQARALLETGRDITKTFSAHLIGHAHMDINWLWPQEETNRMVERDFSTIDLLMDRYPDFNITQSQTELLEIAREKYPRLFERIKKRVEENRIELADSAWVEGDLNMADGETLARHIKYSRGFNTNHFGKTSCLLWEPDTFGHPASIPELMKKSGLRYYYHYRLGPQTPLYRWVRGASGVTAFSSIYINPVDPQKIVHSAVKIHSDTGSRESVFVFGVGDHGGGPTAREIERARYLDSLPGMPKIIFSRMADFFKAAEESARSLPRVRGEHNPIFSGCYTTHARTKQLNRRAENLIQLLEHAFVLRSGDNINEEADSLLFDHWRKVMVNQFHDIICGCGIAETYHQADQELMDVCRQTRGALVSLLGNDPAGNGEPLVYNLDGFFRKETVSVDCSSGYAGLSGQSYEGSIYFYCETPPFSAVCVGQMRSDEENGTRLEEKQNHIEVTSKYFKMRVNRESGIIQELIGLTDGVSYIEPVLWRDIRYNMMNNCFQIDYETPHPMSAWVIGPVESTDYLISGADVKIVSTGPIMTVVEIKHTFLDSSIREEIFFYNDLPWIDFNIHVDWCEMGGPHTRSPMLRLNFMPELSGKASGTWEIPYGWIVRRTDGTDFPALRWIDISDHEKGFTLVNNGTYGYNIQGNTIRANLIRSSYGPDPHPDRGKHRFGFRLIPHTGPLDPAAAYRHGIAFNRPLMPVESTRSNGDDHKPIAAINNDGMVLSSLHPDEAVNGAAVFRLVEYRGEHQDFTVSFGRKADAVFEISVGEDIVFREVSGECSLFQDTAGPFEIKTYRVIWKNQS
ncbi:MAG: glycoside hydrolase family 38 C-terminal domain-containing protein [Spirochaetia bacterium]